jgi:hypothetical protein
MLTWRSGGAILVAALVAGGSVCWTAWERPCDVDAAPPPGGTLTLTGYLDSPGIDPGRCQARCTSMRLEEHPVVHLVDIDAEGRFEFTGLEDVDHCIEIVLRVNPALVVGRAEYARPGGDELVILADPTMVFGPSGFRQRD